MSSALADDPNKNIVVYVNNFFPELVPALSKLSQKLGRPLRGVMLVDAERKASGNYLPAQEGTFEEIVTDFSDDVALRKTIKTLEDNLLIVGSSSESSQLYFKKVIPHVPYVLTPTESSLEWSTDKGKMRKLLSAYDQTISPKAIPVNDASEENLRMLSAELEFPVIVKPSNLAASMLVNKAANYEELEHLLEESFLSLNKIYPLYRGLGNKTIVVEEFVEGDLYSADAYVDSKGGVYILPFIHFKNGVQAGVGGYQEYERETYLTLTDQEIQEGLQVTEKAIRAIGLRSAVAHIELFHTAYGWKIVELGARPGGWRQEMYELSYGIDHAYNEFLIKLDLKPEMPSALKTHSAMFCIDAPEVGIVESIVGVDEARMIDRMDIVRVHAKVGDKAIPTSEGGGLIIEGLMHGEDPEKLRHDINAVRKTIVVNIKKDEG